MPTFRKKPVVIEAEEIQSYHDLPRIAAWCGGVYGQETDGPAYLTIPTLEGVMRADVGDWVIRGVSGEFYPCKHHIFIQTYDPVED